MAAMAVMVAQAVWVRPLPAEEPSVGFSIRPHHTGISVADLDESISWYGKMLGFDLVRRMHKDADPEMAFALLRRDNSGNNFELLQIKDSPS